MSFFQIPEVHIKRKIQIWPVAYCSVTLDDKSLSEDDKRVWWTHVQGISRKKVHSKVRQVPRYLRIHRVSDWCGPDQLSDRIAMNRWCTTRLIQRAWWKALSSLGPADRISGGSLSLSEPIGSFISAVEDR